LLNKLKCVPVKVCNYEVFMMFNARRLKMDRSAFSALVVAAALGGSLHNATGQMINPTVQTSSTRVVASRSAPATAAKPVASARVGPQVAPRPTSLNPQRFNPNLPRTIAQPPANLQRTYAPPVRTSNPGFATLNAPRGGPVQQPITVDPATRQTELRTLAAMRQRGVVTREGNILDPATRQNEIHTLAAMRERRGLVPGQANTLDSATRETESRTVQKMREHRGLGTDNRTLATIDPQPHVTKRDPEAGPQREKPEAPKDAHGKKWRHKKDHISHDEAFRRHWHEWHDRNWWHDHCDTIVFVNTAYYFLDGSYWYPAYGYDPLQTYYDYDGPVYTYSNLLPDEVIANVQTALQDAGYYFGSITGSLSVDTRAAIANFQRDYGLPITGAIDAETVEALGLD
jgi:putative peptidoglycan binding protein